MRSGCTSCATDLTTLGARPAVTPAGARTTRTSPAGRRCPRAPRSPAARTVRDAVAALVGLGDLLAAVSEPEGELTPIATRIVRACAPGPGWFRCVQPEVQTDHPDHEAHPGRTQRQRCAEQLADPAPGGGHHQRRAHESGNGVQPA